MRNYFDLLCGAVGEIDYMKLSVGDESGYVEDWFVKGALLRQPHGVDK